MKTFFKKHRIVLFALCAVLGFGVLAGLALAGAIRLSMRDLSFATVADAHTATEEPLMSANSEQPTLSPMKLSAATIAEIVANTEARRDGLIPHRVGRMKADGGTWENTEFDNAQRDALMEKAQKLTVTLFGQSIESLTGCSASSIRAICLKDSTGFRGSIVIVTDPERLYRLTLHADNGALINADLLVFPEYAADPAVTEQDAKRIAEALGMQATVLQSDIGRNIQEGHEYDLCSDTGTCLTVLYYGDRLTQVAVYPNAEAMYEDVYFQADVRYGNLDLTYPQDFSEPEEPTDMHEKLISERILRTVRRAVADITGTQYALTVKIRHDNSGAREDIYVVEGEDFSCTVSAHSRNVMAMTCELPCPTLLDIPYERMGGAEYAEVTKLIAEKLLKPLSGKTAGEPFVNAIYDGCACTMDVVMSDGTAYELKFIDGTLTEIAYYAEEAFIIDAPGWVADNVYTNRVTGEQTIPSIPDWDGDLHIKKPHNNE